jgi:hypothetical protein
MKLQTSCSLHLIFSQPADVSEAVTRLTGFLADQGVHDQKFLNEFQVAATKAIHAAMEEGCAGKGDRFVEIALTINSVEVQLEIVEPLEQEELSAKVLLPEDSREEEGRGRSSMGQTESCDIRPDAMRVLILKSPSEQ